MSFTQIDRELGLSEPEGLYTYTPEDTYTNGLTIDRVSQYDNTLINLERELSMISIADKLIYKPEPRQSIYLNGSKIELRIKGDRVSPVYKNIYVKGKNKTAILLLLIKNSKMLNMSENGDWANYIVIWNNKEYKISIHYNMKYSVMEKYTNKKKIDEYYKQLSKERTRTVHQTSFESVHPVYGSSENSLGYLATEREVEIVYKLIESVEDIMQNTTDVYVKSALKELADKINKYIWYRYFCTYIN